MMCDNLDDKDRTMLLVIGVVFAVWALGTLVYVVCLSIGVLK